MGEEFGEKSEREVKTPIIDIMKGMEETPMI